ncbi:MAG TPA: Ku protein [Candidatus Udaeobacter sp.]|nr:Ku protein [Candidatus Udaeobacter sp.]
MAARKSKSQKNKRQNKRRSKPRSLSRPLWKGSIDFGLVNIPVSLYSAETSDRLDFDLLDKRDFSRVRYRRVNEKTGQEVPWEQTIKGYQYEKGEYVALTDEDFVRANVESTQSITITDFVDATEISSIYYDKPYYLEPIKNGRRAYALLREVLKKTGKVGIAKVVIRTREHLAAVMVEGPLLILNLLRFAHELRDASALDVPETGSKRAAVSERELIMAERLLESMIGEWNPAKYRDEYHDDLLKLIDKKVQSGQAKAVAPAEAAPRPQRQGKVIDIMHLLQQSVKQAQKKEEPARRRKAS